MYQWLKSPSVVQDLCFFIFLGAIRLQMMQSGLRINWSVEFLLGLEGPGYCSSVGSTSRFRLAVNIL